MIALFCPPHYNTQFATLEYVSPDWGYKIVTWAYGKPTGHAWHETIYEAVLAIVSNGWQWASEGMKRVFSEDVIMSGE